MHGRRLERRAKVDRLLEAQRQQRRGARAARLLDLPAVQVALRYGVGPQTGLGVQAGNGPALDQQGLHPPRPQQGQDLLELFVMEASLEGVQPIGLAQLLGGQFLPTRLAHPPPPQAAAPRP